MEKDEEKKAKEEVKSLLEASMKQYNSNSAAEEISKITEMYFSVFANFYSLFTKLLGETESDEIIFAKALDLTNSFFDSIVQIIK